VIVRSSASGGLLLKLSKMTVAYRLFDAGVRADVSRAARHQDRLFRPPRGGQIECSKPPVDVSVSKLAIAVIEMP